MARDSSRRILFVEPPPLHWSKVPERFAGCTYMLYPLPDLAQLYLMSYLEREGHTVGLINAVLERLSPDRFVRRIAEWAPDLVILHSVLLAKPGDLVLLRLLLERLANSKVLLHGPEPTRVPQEYLGAVPSHLADDRLIIFRGEPERHIREYICNGEAPGLSLVQDEETHHIPHSHRFIDLDDIPFTFHRHPAVERYKGHYFNPKFSRRPVAGMLASRGCPWRCLYCVPNSVSFARELEYSRAHPGKKPPAYYASADRVIAEFREIAAAGYRAVMIMDDQFLAQPTRTLEICRGVAGLGLKWGCLSRPDCLVDEDLVKALSRAGCVSIDLGVESLSQHVLDAVRKEMDVETVYRAVPLLRRFGIEPKINIMFGTCALEREEDIRHTVRELIRLGVHHVMFAVATPFKGTTFYEQASRDGFIVDESERIDPFSKSVVSYPHLSSGRLDRLVAESYRRFYLRPSQIWWRLSHASSPKSIVDDVRLALRLLVRR